MDQFWGHLWIPVFRQVVISSSEPRLENILKGFLPRFWAQLTKRVPKRFSEIFYPPFSALSRKDYDFYGFRSLFDPNPAPFLARFGLDLAPFLAPLRGAILSENTRKPNVFHCFGSPKRLTFGAHFWHHYCSIFAPFRSPFRAPFGPGPNLLFCIVFRLARPSLGAGAKRFSPDPSLLKIF